MEPSLAELIAGGAGLIGSGWGAKILTEIIRQKLRGGQVKLDVPKAENGFINHSYLSNHCQSIQESCAKIMAATLKAEVAPIREQLVSVKEVMQRTMAALDRHERILDELRSK